MPQYENQLDTPNPPSLLGLRIVWCVIAVLTVAFWSFSGLSIWHLMFFCCLSAALYFSYRRYYLPLIMYFSMMLLYWVIAPAIQTSIGVGFYSSGFKPPNFNGEAFAFCFIHIIGIVLGTLIKVKSKRSIRATRPISVASIILVLLLLIVLIVVVGSEIIFLARYEQSDLRLESHVILLRNMIKLFPSMLIVYFILAYRGGNYRISDAVLLSGLVLGLLIVSNPLNTARFLSLFGILMIFIAYAIRYQKQRFLGWLIAAAPAYAITLLGATSAMRNGVANFSFERILYSLQTLEFGSYAVFLDAIRMDNFPQDNWLLSHLLIVIPRFIWLGKADSIGVHVAHSSGYVIDNISLTPFFNAYVDFGLMGVFLLSVVFGFISKILNPSSEPPSFHSRRFMYGVIFMGSMPMFFRGELGTAMLGFYPAILVYELTRFATIFRLNIRAR